MKKSCAILLFILAIAACNLTQKTATVTIGNTPEEDQDSVRYELIILDPGFESWMISNARPVWFHSKVYLENWNRQYVSAWNSKSVSGRQGRYFDTYIDYQNHIDYGLELNYKLFYYFQYVERKLRIPILTEGLRPQGI
jgi:hypothetical protein